ncbi:alpha/beta hydrolase [Geothrix rubra]|uniref:Alpha/beta hydrolase n=1 Tax=Geothrix rubra TaxID=2927977 RepID=A0ABQ5Q7J6_9BACT|nr:alpha/beta hydrolase [Geothrix rubra]GLH70365.1 alpha/beta hydrolase [Geothrix rubra]
MRANLNGIQIAYTDLGKGLPLLFVHGFPLNGGAWAGQVGAFRSNCRVIVPDLRGFGRSGALPGPVPMSRYAEDLGALVQQLNAPSVILLGHSMGGYVALAFARAFPKAVRGLVLVGTKAGADSPEAAAARREAAAKVGTEGTQSLVEAMAPKMLSAANTDAAMAQAVRHLMASSRPDGVVGALLGMAERPDAREWLGGIRVPTLVIAGEDDAIIPTLESEALAKAIPGAQLKLIPRAGHLVAFEQPEAFNEALRDWLARPGAGMDAGPFDSTQDQPAELVGVSPESKGG